MSLEDLEKHLGEQPKKTPEDLEKELHELVRNPSETQMFTAEEFKRKVAKEAARLNPQEEVPQEVSDSDRNPLEDLLEE